MGYRLQMSAEIHDWLAELRDSDPPSAVAAAQTLAALATEGDHLGPPLVTAVPSRLAPDELVPMLDQRYQYWLQDLSVLRRQVADAATLRRRIERQLSGAEPADDEVAAARAQLAAATEAEERLSTVSRQEQMRADAFRTRKEVLKALYTAARAEQFIEQAQDQDGDGPPAPEVAARLEDVTGQIEQELNWEAPAEGLMQLRTPEPTGICLLFAAEPPGTALLIAVLEGPDAARDHYREAVLLASSVLRAVRAGQAGEATARTFNDAQSFLEEFFPGRAGELRDGAATLVAASHARPLAEQRVRLGLTQAQVAARMGVREERVSAIERAGSGATEVRALAAYVEALGGRLDITADFGTDRVRLH